MRRRTGSAAAGVVAAALAAGAAALAAAASPAADVAVTDGDGAAVPSAWRLERLPDAAIPASRLDAVRLDGRPALRLATDASYATLTQPLPAGTPPGRLSWRWRVDRPLAAADLRRKDGDDAAVKVCVAFDQPLAEVPLIERQLVRLARARTGRPLPTATLCYVWDAALPAGTLLPNAYTGRVRQLVLRGAGTAPGAWGTEDRDLAADFRRAFGDESATVPAPIALFVGADADNTRGASLAHLADLRLHGSTPAAPVAADPAR